MHLPLCLLLTVGNALAATPTTASQVVPPIAVAHVGQVAEEFIDWRTTIVAGGAEPKLPAFALAVSLPPETKIEPKVGLRGEDGQLVAVRPSTWRPRIDSDGRWIRTAVIETRQVLALGAAGHRLAPPLLAGDVVQRVTLRGRKTAFVPDKRLGIVARVGYRASNDTSRAQRRRVDRLLGGSSIGALYLGPDVPLSSTGGLVGTLHATSWLRYRGLWLSSGIFVVVVAVFLLAYKRLSRRIEVESVDRMLAERFDELEDESETQQHLG